MSRRPPHLEQVPSVADGAGVAIALAADVVLLVAGIYSGHHHHRPLITVIQWVVALLFLLVGAVATRRGALLAGRLTTARRGVGEGAIVRLVASGGGSILLLFGCLAIFGVSFAHLLLGAGLLSVVLGIAAQQSLGNLFAALVLLVARPFRVGDAIIVRSGTLGVVQGRVIGIGLAYVILETDDGVLRIPNAVMLASGVGARTAPAD